VLAAADLAGMMAACTTAGEAPTSRV
jgi:hypothetical protein